MLKESMFIMHDVRTILIFTVGVTGFLISKFLPHASFYKMSLQSLGCSIFYNITSFNYCNKDLVVALFGLGKLLHAVIHRAVKKIV